ncbi:MAG: hypothetical protein ACI9J3_002227 [Parvicellaceae bacterium]
MRHIYLLLLFAPLFCNSQIYDGICAGGSQDEIGYDFIYNSDGSYTLLTSTRSVAAESEDIGLFKITANKDFHWLKVYGSGNHEYPYSIITTSDGGYLISGSKWDAGFARMNVYLLKLDAEFRLEWENYYGGSHRDEGFSVIECASGGFVVAGMTRSKEAGELGDFYLIKVNDDGSLIWEQTLGLINSKDYLFDVVETQAGNFMAVGAEAGHYHYSTFEFTTSHTKSCILKYDANGAFLWKKNYGGPQNCWYKELVQTTDGNFYAIGSSQNNSFGSFDITLTKFNTSGDSIWERNYGGTQYDYGESILVSSDNYIYLAGAECNDTTNYTTDISVIKMDTSGTIIWKKLIGGDQSELAFKIKEIKNGVAVLGSTKSYGNGESDAYLVELDTLGNVLFSDEDLPVFGINVSVYPNPSYHGFNIVVNTDLICDDIEVEFMDESGRLLAIQKIDSKDFNFVNTDTWGHGIYFYKMQSTCFETKVGKLIVR